MPKHVMQKIAREFTRPFRRWRMRHRPRSQSPGPNVQPRRQRAASKPGAQYPADFSPDEVEIVQAVAPFTMTCPERIWAVIHAVQHVVRSAIPGDIVECGVWKGGSMMAAALALKRLGDRQRVLHLYDTFEGMPPPAEIDRDYAGLSAEAQLRTADRATSNIWCLAGLEEVHRNMLATGYPGQQIRFIAGRVEETIPRFVPERIAVLRLDTDWYESTRHELTHLYPRLQPGGVLIVDDYGYWQGARRATDEFIEAQDRPPLLCRIDFTGRIAVKPG